MKLKHLKKIGFKPFGCFRDSFSVINHELKHNSPQDAECTALVGRFTMEELVEKMKSIQFEYGNDAGFDVMLSELQKSEKSFSNLACLIANKYGI